MQIRTQVYCFVLFLAALMTGSLVHSQARGVKNAIAQIPAATAQKTGSDPAQLFATVADRYAVPAPNVQAVAAKGLPADEVVMVYFVAENSVAQPDQIVADRLAGKSWRQIAMAAGLQPEQFYYPMPNSAARPPFVNVYAVYHRVPRDRWTWDQLQLTDADLANLANLQLLASSDGRPAADVVRMRSQGFDYVTISNTLLPGQKTAEHPPRKADKAIPS
jgi:hypothetical protein